MVLDAGKDTSAALVSPVEGVPYQDCWVTRGGIPLEQQVRDYDKNFAPFSTKVKLKLNPEREIDTLDKNADALTQSGSTADLQEQLIVLNANEFRLRDKPTSDEFEAILADFSKWHLRAQPDHFVGGSEARAKVAEKVNQVVDYARTRFSVVTN